MDNDCSEVTSLTIPKAPLGHGGGSIPLLGMGTAPDPPVAAEVTKAAVLNALKLGYRHFDTACLYNTEQPLGKAISEALCSGLIKSRDELFITSKLWCSDGHHERVLPALRRTLQLWESSLQEIVIGFSLYFCKNLILFLLNCCVFRNLNLEYIDLYLIHWPVSSKPEIYQYPIKKEDFLAMDYKSVWAAMEECQRLGLTKAIGVSNFSCKKLADIIASAAITPAVNQVEVNPAWQQKKLIEFCEANGILVTAYSPLAATGTFYGSNIVLESDVLKEIARARGKTVAQVSLRWAYEQGIALVVKSFNRERMKENLDIFNWELTEEDHKMIGTIPQSRVCTGSDYTSCFGPFRTLEELWDGEL